MLGGVGVVLSACANFTDPTARQVLALAPCHDAALQHGVFRLQEATIEQIQHAMAAGVLSSVELTALYLNRIHAYDVNGIKLNAVPVLNPAALAEAAHADRLRAEGRKADLCMAFPIPLKTASRLPA